MSSEETQDTDSGVNEINNVLGDSLAGGSERESNFSDTSSIQETRNAAFGAFETSLVTENFVASLSERESNLLVFMSRQALRELATEANESSSATEELVDWPRGTGHQRPSNEQDYHTHIVYDMSVRITNHAITVSDHVETVAACRCSDHRPHQRHSEDNQRPRNTDHGHNPRMSFESTLAATEMASQPFVDSTATTAGIDAMWGSGLSPPFEILPTSLPDLDGLQYHSLEPDMFRNWTPAGDVYERAMGQVDANLEHLEEFIEYDTEHFPLTNQELFE